MLQQVFVIIFVQQELYHGVRLVVRISRNRRENLTVIELTQTTTTTMPVNSRRNLHTHSISRGFSRGL